MATPKKDPKAQTPAKKPDDAGSKSKALKVVPKRDGFRRAGIEFPNGETTIPLADLSDAQFEQLTTEPMLVTMVVEINTDTADSA